MYGPNVYGSEATAEANDEDTETAEVMEDDKRGEEKRSEEKRKEGKARARKRRHDMRIYT